MTQFGSGLTRKFPVGMLILCLMLFVMTPVAQAAYEVDKSTLKPDVQTGVQAQWKDKNFNVEFNAVAMTGTDLFVRYIYKWSSTSTLSDTEFNSNVNDGEATLATTTYIVSRLKENLVAMDYGDTLYLHLKTEYLSNGVPTLSQDLNGDVNGVCTGYGPFLIDNTAPTGTIRLVDGSGNTITWADSTVLMVNVAASKDPQKVYLYETSVRPATGQNYGTGALSYGLGDPSLGPRSLFAWFEDAVGNISDIPAKVDFTLLPAVHISPWTATIDLSVGTQTFQVGDGATAYRWNIINQVQDPSGTNVATFANGLTQIDSATSVTVTAKNKGTFKLQADPNPDPNVTGDELTSGTITVVQTTRTNSIVLVAGWNWVSFNVLPPAESRTLSAFFGANASKVKAVKSGAYSASYSLGSWIGNLANTNTFENRIAQGFGFKIQTETGFTLEVTGQPIDPTTPIQLTSNWTWVAYLPNVSMDWATALAGIKTDKLVTVKQGPQSKAKQQDGTWIGNLSTMLPGKLYTIQTNATGQLIYPAP